MKRIALLLLLAFAINTIHAQKEANFWYFGEYAGLSFGLGLPIAMLDGQLNTGEGCSSISTESGELLFYTDGTKVWNKNHLLMPNGTGLLGHYSSTQSGIIVPKPGNPNHYYIFTVDARDNNLVQGMKYSLVDMTLAGGLGDVVPNQKNVSLVAPTCEKVTAVGHSDGTSIWVITHHFGSNAFYAYKVTTTGVQTTPVISNVGVMVLDYEDSKGYIKASPDGGKIAIAHNTMNTVEILDFNNTTGVISNPITDNSFTGFQGGPYGVEFSPNSELLYIAEWKDASKIHQYDLTAGTPQAILNSRTVVATIGQNSEPVGALQLGPDNRMYCARRNANYLGVITNPNTLGTACNYISDGVFLGGRTSSYGLPPFIQSFFTLNVEFYYDPPCHEIPTQFYLTASDDPDSVIWDFGDPGSGNNSSTQINPIHQFSGPGFYLVTVQAWISGHSANAFHLVIVKGPPEADLTADNISIPYLATTTLHGEVTSPAENFTFQWSPAEKLVNPDTLDPTTIPMQFPTTFTLVVTDTLTGCDSVMSIFINVTGSPLSVEALANPGDICRGEQSQLNATGYGGSETYTYSWTSDPPGFNSDLQNPVVIPQVTTEYFVVVDDGYNTSENSVVVTVNPDITSDAGEDQTIPYGTAANLTGSSSAANGAYYHWEPYGMVSNPNIANPFTVDLTQNTMFTLWTDDQVTGCESPRDTVFIYIEGGPLSVSAFVDNEEICQGTEITLTASPSGGNPDNYEYSWSDNFGYNYPSEPVISTTPSLSTTYTVSVTDGFTTEEAEVFVQVNPGPAFTINTGADTIMACPYDTVMLECRPHHEDWTYYWSNGAITPYIKSGSTGIGYDIKHYTLTVHSSAECIIEKEVFVIFDFSYCFGVDDPEGYNPLTLYPNPASGQLKVTFDGDVKTALVSIFDLSGKQVADTRKHVSADGNLEFMIDTAGLDDGIYLVKLVAGGTVYCSKLVVRR